MNDVGTKSEKEDKKTIAINNAGYWELDEKSKSILQSQEKKRETAAFMKLHQKQIAEIIRRF